MDKTIIIGLSGHDEKYQLDPAAYDALRSYLDQAAERLHDDPDRADVLSDLERSVGDKLSAALGSQDRIVTVADINGVLEQIGAVDPGTDATGSTGTAQPGARRRLHRIPQGQMLTGVCNGLADYAQVRVDWVRTGFVLGSLVTAGLFGLVYVALIFIMPVDDTAQAPAARRR